MLWPVVLAGTLEAHGWRVVYRALAAITAGILPLAMLLWRRVPAEAIAR